MKNKKNLSGFAPIIILILLVLVGVGAYYFGTLKNKIVPVASVQPSSSPLAKSTADPIANWKTYTNEKLPYTISYPAEFQADVTWEQNSGAIIGFRIDKKDTEPTGPFGSYISIRINNPQKPSENNFDPYLSMAVGETKETQPLTQQSYTRLADIKIGGMVAKSYINQKPWEFAGTGYLYIIDYKKSLYIIDEGVGTDNVSKALLDQILSTFKFTK